MGHLEPLQPTLLSVVCDVMALPRDASVVNLYRHGGSDTPPNTQSGHTFGVKAVDPLSRSGHTHPMWERQHCPLQSVSQSITYDHEF